MFPTVEVRWFYRGNVPPAVTAWFERGRRRPEAPLGRTDHYLRLADGDALGIKLREGRIEVKQRCRQVGVISFGEWIAGRVEGWRKWSFLLAEAGDLKRLAAPAAAWIAVQKRRRLYRYEVRGDRVVSLPPGLYPVQGGHAELTDVRAAGQEWWTLGIEAFGEEATLEACFHMIAAHVLTGDGTPVLDAKRSCGYPGWLELVAMSK
jgi:hypothetical protein